MVQGKNQSPLTLRSRVRTRRSTRASDVYNVCYFYVIVAPKTFELRVYIDALDHADHEYVLKIEF